MKILTIGDVHGRTFWKKALNIIDEMDKVVFLGDYLDPYFYEGISIVEALSNFKEIIEFKRNYYDKVVLLIGNHDLHYWPEFKKQWGCRRDDRNFDEISKLFLDNLDCFNISFQHEKYLFTHAGVKQEWLDTINGDISFGTMTYPEMIDVESFNVDITNLDSLLKLEGGTDALFVVSRERGGSWPSGSCLWADVTEHDPFKTEFPGIYQIFGHTMTFPEIDEPFITSTFAMLDAQQCFVLDTETNNIEKC